MATVENLGPAERIINTLLQYNDHLYHGRPGVVTPAGRNQLPSWRPCTYKDENGDRVVYLLEKVGKKEKRTRLGLMSPTDANGKITVIANGRDIAEYRPAGIFPEVAFWMYSQVAEVWKLDNEFAARWASFAFGQEHRDLKVILAAFMLVQSRKGDPVKDGEKVAFLDDDFRAVGEAMLLLTRKDGKDFNSKLVHRVREVLEVPAVAKLNHDLGFGQSTRRAFLGRWDSAARAWLQFRVENPKMLDGLVKSGQRRTVMLLAERSRYKPTTEKFYQTLRWKQHQAADGHRQIALDMKVAAGESWAGLTEKQICKKIISEKMNFKRIAGLLPNGWTRATMAAAIEAGSFTNKDLVIYTPTLEDLGLLEVQDIKSRWETAMKAADDMRAVNIAQRVKSQDVKEKLETAADTALKNVVQEAMKQMHAYVVIDISGSMQNSIATAKGILEKLLPAFPEGKLHISVFNTQGREIVLKAHSSAGVNAAFKGVVAGGGTHHASGIRALRDRKPADDEDSIIIFVGDQGEQGTFTTEVNNAGLRPMAFGLVHLPGDRSTIVEDTARELRIPCMRLDEKMFADTYAVPRTLRALIAATPIGAAPRHVAAPRVTLVEQILKTPLLAKPVWA